MRADQFDAAQNHGLEPSTLTEMLTSRGVLVRGLHEPQEPVSWKDDQGEIEFIQLRVPERFSKSGYARIAPSDLIRARISGKTVLLPKHPDQQLVPIQFTQVIKDGQVFERQMESMAIGA